MGIITEKDIAESNRLKRETCNNIKATLKGKLSAYELEKLEEAFYTTAEGYMFSKKNKTDYGKATD